VIPEPKCLVCGHKLDQQHRTSSIEVGARSLHPDYECPRCGFLIAQHTIESLTADQDNAP
jgi:DNA-directed RNA polymerase subunit RPC12/RpoP